MSLLLLTSGAYVEDELAAEFGRVPPAFLPVGNRRLFHLHAEHLRSRVERMALTVPESFVIPAHDRDLLDSLGIEVVPVVEGLRLGESIVYALNVLGTHDCPLEILHGDTLITGLSATEADVFSIHPADTFYHWAACRYDQQGQVRIWTLQEEDYAADTADHVLSGYFSFSSAICLIQAITRARGDFIEGLNAYAEKRPLSPLGKVGTWLDFGHLQTYYASRWYLTTQRAFNDLQVSGQVVTKSSEKRHKMLAEAAWFRELPSELRVYAPIYLGESEEAGKPGYRLSHEYLPTLSELFVFGRQNPRVWERIFGACAEFLEVCTRYPGSASVEEQALELYRGKAQARIRQFCDDNGLDPERAWRIDGVELPSLITIVEELGEAVGDASEVIPGVMHGDLCFSNTFFDFRRGAIKVIDPRGHLADDSPSLYGDVRYDVAKLCHSADGQYDFIIAGYFQCRRDGEYALSLQLPDDPLLRRIRDAFGEHEFAGCSPRAPAIQAATALLFLSMLPLHADAPHRQQALLARGLQLYLRLREGGR